MHWLCRWQKDPLSAKRYRIGLSEEKSQIKQVLETLFQHLCCVMAERSSASDSSFDGCWTIGVWVRILIMTLWGTSILDELSQLLRIMHHRQPIVMYRRKGCSSHQESLPPQVPIYSWVMTRSNCVFIMPLTSYNNKSVFLTTLLWLGHWLSTRGLGMLHYMV